MMDKCICGFKFSGAGEFRNCEAFITNIGDGGVICPNCGRMYVHGKESIVREKPETNINGWGINNGL